MIFKKKKKDVPEPKMPQVARPGDVLLVERNGETVLIDENARIEINISGVKKEPQIEQKADGEPEKPMLIIDSVVKETNGYIEIKVTCELELVPSINRQTLIKKDQILRVDMFYQLYTPTEFHHFVSLDINGSKTDFCFERKEDAEKLYNALARILKKNEFGTAKGR